MMSRYLVC